MNDRVNLIAAAKTVRSGKLNKMVQAKQALEDTFLDRIIKNTETHRADLNSSIAFNEQWKSKAATQYYDEAGQLHILQPKSLFEYQKEDELRALQDREAKDRAKIQAEFEIRRKTELRTKEISSTNREKAIL